MPWPYLQMFLHQWVHRGGSAGAGVVVGTQGVWASAHHVARMHESLGFLSIMSLIFSLAIFGALVIWKGAVPRWVGGIGALSGLLLVLALIGAAISEDAFWWTFVASAMMGFLWLVVTGAWLALKGVNQPPSHADAM